LKDNSKRNAFEIHTIHRLNSKIKTAEKYSFL
jgi:hypothetical protein